MIVTGGASGIGLATVRRLLAAGTQVFAFDRDEAALARVSNLDPGRAVLVDVSDAASVEAAFAFVASEALHLHALVNVAGVVRVGPFDDIDLDDWLETYRVNVVGTYLCMRAALPLLRSAPATPRIVNVASIAAKQPTPFLAAYGASKAAMLSLTRSAAVALAPDILVNAVCPGVIDTPLWEVLARDVPTVGATRAATADEGGARTPLGRPGQPEEVAGAIAFLLGPDSTYLTGEVLDVNGGGLID